MHDDSRSELWLQQDWKNNGAAQMMTNGGRQILDTNMGGCVFSDSSVWGDADSTAPWLDTNDFAGFDVPPVKSYLGFDALLDHDSVIGQGTDDTQSCLGFQNKPIDPTEGDGPLNVDTVHHSCTTGGSQSIENWWLDLCFQNKLNSSVWVNNITSAGNDTFPGLTQPTDHNHHGLDGPSMVDFILQNDVQIHAGMNNDDDYTYPDLHTPFDSASVSNQRHIDLQSEDLLPANPHGPQSRIDDLGTLLGPGGVTGSKVLSNFNLPSARHSQRMP